MANLDTADIILVTSEAMMDALMKPVAGQTPAEGEEAAEPTGRLADLTEFYASETYGLLNVNIAAALLEASKIDGKYYTVPNNRTLGSYTYVCIDKNEVHKNRYYPLAASESYPDMISLDIIKDAESVVRLRRALAVQDILTGKSADDVSTLKYKLVEAVYSSEWQSWLDIQNTRDAKTLYSMLKRDEGMLSDFTEKLTAEGKTLEEAETLMNSKDPADAEAIAALREMIFSILEKSQKDGLLSRTTVGDLVSRYVMEIYYAEPETPVGNAGEESTEDVYKTALEAVMTASEISGIHEIEYATVERPSELNIPDYAGQNVICMTGCTYEDKALWEAAGYVCNVVEYPSVDRATAFASAFAAVKHDDIPVARVMEIMYAINADSYLHNLLQYGVEMTNYTEKDGYVVSHETGDNVYLMNPLYTGNAFTLKYCERVGLTEESVKNGKLQNKEAVAKLPEPEPTPEEPAA